jgi:twitching motility protein PilT
MAKIDELLKIVVRQKASDLHLTSSFRPYVRESGDMQPLAEAAVLTPEMTRELIYEIIPPRKRTEFEELWDVDFAYEAQDVGRFRVNVFIDRFGIGAVLRTIPTRVPTADELNLPKAVRDFCYLTKGLVVVTGPTGSGKSTTLAAMIDLINKTRSDHIITIEDPIEFVHLPQKCLINQREVHGHTKSFANALRAALREDPDIVMVGEMRDLETMEIAIETAETGHLVFGTLHTNTAAGTVDRIIDKFPADRQNQVRTMLADSLKGVIAQTLCRKIPKGRVAAMEILVATSAIAANIRDAKTYQIPSAMQIGRSLGMQMFTDVLAKLVVEKLIAPEEAYLKAIDKEAVKKKLADAGYEVKLAHDAPGSAGAPAEADKAAAAAYTLGQSIQTLRTTLQQNPDSADALNNLAWILATIARAQPSEREEAIRVAERALRLTQGRNPAVLDTLGAAYAQIGRFEQAIESARKGLKLAESAGQKELADALRKRLALYEARTPFHQ